MERGCGLDVIPHSLDCLKIENEPGVVVLKTIAIQSEIRLRIEGIRPNQTLKIVSISVAILITIRLESPGPVIELPEITHAILIQIKESESRLEENREESTPQNGPDESPEAGGISIHDFSSFRGCGTVPKKRDFQRKSLEKAPTFGWKHPTLRSWSNQIYLPKTMTTVESSD
jgi:hypothetical protein